MILITEFQKKAKKMSRYPVPYTGDSLPDRPRQLVSDKQLLLLDRLSEVCQAGSGEERDEVKLARKFRSEKFRGPGAAGDGGVT